MTPWSATCQASLSFIISLSLLKLMSIQSVMPSNHLIFYHPLLLPSIFPSIRIFSIESALCIMWSKYWSFSISPSNEYSRLISFRIDWFDLLAVPWRIPKSLHQHHSSNSLGLGLLDGPTLTFIYDYWKKHSLTIQTFVGKLKSLLFNALSRFVIAFLPNSACLLTLWL